MTLLDTVQRTLSLINSQNVSAIDETEESEQVVILVKNIIDELFEHFPWLSRKTRTKLEVTAVANEMTLPTTASNVEWIYYNTSDGRREITYIEPDEMVELFNQRLDASLTNIDSVGAYNDQDPEHWTTFDNVTIVFDGYNGSLAKNKTDVLVWLKPVYPSVGTDTFDNIPTQFHVVILNGVIGEAFRTLKGDDRAADVYTAKYMRGRIKMKRWHELDQSRGSQERMTWERTYGRQRVSSARNTPRRIAE